MATLNPTNAIVTQAVHHAAALPFPLAWISHRHFRR